MTVTVARPTLDCRARATRTCQQVTSAPGGVCGECADEIGDAADASVDAPF